MTARDARRRRNPSSYKSRYLRRFRLSIGQRAGKIMRGHKLFFSPVIRFRKRLAAWKGEEDGKKERGSILLGSRRSTSAFESVCRVAKRGVGLGRSSSLSSSSSGYYRIPLAYANELRRNVTLWKDY